MDFVTGWDTFSNTDSLASLYSSQYSANDSLSIQDLSVTLSPLDGDVSSLVSLALPAAPEYITPEYTTPPITTPSTTISESVLTATSPISTKPSSQSQHHNPRKQAIYGPSTRSPRPKRPKSHSPPPALGTPAITLCEVWLESYPHIFPKPKHIRALTDLTDQPVHTIENWLSQRMRHHPPSHSHPHSLSPPPLGQTRLLGTDDSPTEASFKSNPPSTLNATSLAAVLAKSSAGKPGRHCTPTLSLSLLVHDPAKPFQCTRSCGKSFAQRDDWRKHEELRWPQEGWVCLAPSKGAASSCTAPVSMSGTRNEASSVVGGAVGGRVRGGGDGGSSGDSNCGMSRKRQIKGVGKVQSRADCQGELGRSSSTASPPCARLSHRRQHFRQHFRRLHSHLLPHISQYEARGHVTIQSRGWDERCGFCGQKMRGWRERIMHIGKHFLEGRDMRGWREDREGEREG